MTYTLHDACNCRGRAIGRQLVDPPPDDQLAVQDYPLMMEPTPSQDPTPEGPLAEYQLDRRLTLELGALSLIGMVVGFGAFSGLYALVAGTPPSFRFVNVGYAPLAILLDTAVLIALAVGVALPHEWVHGLAIRRYGGMPRYGVGIAYFVLPYAFATTDHRFTRSEYQVVLLAPLVCLTAVGVAGMLAFGWGWLVIPLTANAAGAVGDLWMALVLLGYRRGVIVEDATTGLRIYGEPADRPWPTAIGVLLWEIVAGAAVGLLLVLIALGLGGPLLAGITGVDSLILGTPGTVTHVLSYSTTTGGVSLAVGPGILAVGAAVGLGVGFGRMILRVRRQRRARSRGGSDDRAE